MASHTHTQKIGKKIQLCVDDENDDKGENFLRVTGGCVCVCAKPRHVHLSTFTKNLGIMPIHLFISVESVYIYSISMAMLNVCMRAPKTTTLCMEQKVNKLAKKRLGGGLIYHAILAKCVCGVE